MLNAASLGRDAIYITEQHKQSKHSFATINRSICVSQLVRWELEDFAGATDDLIDELPVEKPDRRQ